MKEYSKENLEKNYGVELIFQLTDSNGLNLYDMIYKGERLAPINGKSGTLEYWGDFLSSNES